MCVEIVLGVNRFSIDNQMAGLRDALSGLRAHVALVPQGVALG